MFCSNKGKQNRKKAMRMAMQRKRNRWKICVEKLFALFTFWSLILRRLFPLKYLFFDSQWASAMNYSPLIDFWLKELQKWRKWLFVWFLRRLNGCVAIRGQLSHILRWVTWISDVPRWCVCVPVFAVAFALFSSVVIGFFDSFTVPLRLKSPCCRCRLLLCNRRTSHRQSFTTCLGCCIQQVLGPGQHTLSTSFFDFVISMDRLSYFESVYSR